MPIRTIIEEHKIANEIDGKKTKNNRLEDIVNGMKWRLAIKPESGTQIENGRFLLANSDDVKTSNRVVMVYKFDDNEVRILDICISSNS